MQQITSAEDLKKAINALEQRQAEEYILLKSQFSVTCLSLRPIYILGKAINGLTKTSELKNRLVRTAIGLIAGYLSRAILVRSSKNPFLRYAGMLLQYGVTYLVSKNSGAIKKIALNFVKKLSDQYQKR
jgi:hypothetical protein